MKKMPCRFSTQSNVTTHRGATSSIGSVEHDCGSIAPESIPVVDATEVKLPGWAVELQMCKIRSSEINAKHFSIICFTGHNNFAICPKIPWKTNGTFPTGPRAIH